MIVKRSVALLFFALMVRTSEQAPTPMSSSVLLGAGVAGGALSAIAAAVMYLRPGGAAGIAVAVADLLILFGFVGLKRRFGGGGRPLAVAIMIANVIAAIASLSLPRIGVGPIFDLFGGLSWLADALAYAVLGGVFFHRRTDVRPGLGIVAGTTSVLRAGAALILAGFQPVQEALGLPDFILLHLWQMLSLVAGAAMGVFFVAARAQDARVNAPM